MLLLILKYIAHMNDLKNFIAQSPLNENPALIKYTNNIIGNIDINLNLDIPLGLEKTKFNGMRFIK